MSSEKYCSWFESQVKKTNSEGLSLTYNILYINLAKAPGFFIIPPGLKAGAIYPELINFTKVARRI